MIRSVILIAAIAAVAGGAQAASTTTVTLAGKTSAVAARDIAAGARQVCAKDYPGLELDGCVRDTIAATYRKLPMTGSSAAAAPAPAVKVSLAGKSQSDVRTAIMTAARQVCAANRDLDSTGFSRAECINATVRATYAKLADGDA